MSELINENVQYGSFRKALLTTVCGAALLSLAAAPGEAHAEDADRPAVWLTLGAHVERMGGRPEIFDPVFLSQFAYLNLDPVLPLQRPARYGIGGEGTISFEPKGTDWVLTVAVRYGRSNGQKHRYQQVAPISYPYQVLGQPMGVKVQSTLKHLNTAADNAETNAIADFQAGKDLGLGLFSSKGDTTLSFGVRFAQFTSRRSANINGVPDFFHSGTQQKYGVGRTNHHYYGTLSTHSDFHGIGPSLSWSASQPFLGKSDDGGVSLDWGVNASVLFGRQKTRGETSSTGEHYTRYVRVAFPSSARHGFVSSYHHHTDISRSHSVVVPNVGGFAGMSLKFPNAKVSLGYRADFFFGAMDGGIDMRKTYDRNFYGPFATISIGLGG